MSKQKECPHPEEAQVEVTDDEGNEDGVYCMACSARIGPLPEPHDPDEHPSHPDHNRQPDDMELTWGGD